MSSWLEPPPGPGGPRRGDRRPSWSRVAPATAFLETCEIALAEADTGAEAAEAMVFGMATFGLDPHSVYLDPEAVELLKKSKGEIQGIGALVTAEDSASGEECNVISDTCASK